MNVSIQVAYNRINTTTPKMRANRKITRLTRLSVFKPVDKQKLLCYKIVSYATAKGPNLALIYTLIYYTLVTHSHRVSGQCFYMKHKNQLCV